MTLLDLSKQKVAVIFGVTQQIQDVNSGGNEAQGLLQYTPGSFNSYAIRGHKTLKRLRPITRLLQ